MFCGAMIGSHLIVEKLNLHFVIQMRIIQNRSKNTDIPHIEHSQFE